MKPAARALLDALVDYAGLFPPAALDLAPAVAAYARHQRRPEAEMLGRFIVPAAQLEALADEIGQVGAEAPWSVSVLGLPADGDDWLGAAQRTLQAARAVEAAHPDRLVCDRFELKLPADLARSPGALTDALGALGAAYSDGAALPPQAALEVPYLDAADAVAPAAQAVVDANGRADRPAFALKFRCGGVTPGLVPDVEVLAGALHAALAAGAPFKATAGLHHPLPNDDEAVGARMFGFLGVFGGAALARVHGLGPDDWAEILHDDDPGAWSVGDDLRWRSLRATAAEVADARQQAALSFGSCSFDEPVEDLRGLGWI